jgi:hypothetical protein
MPGLPMAANGYLASKLLLRDFFGPPVIGTLPFRSGPSPTQKAEKNMPHRPTPRHRRGRLKA